MRLPPFDHVKPKSVEDVLDHLARGGQKTRLLAGGTDLLVNMKLGLTRPETLVSLKSLPELSAVNWDSRGNLIIGASACLSDLAANALIYEKLPALSGAIRSVASRHIRNMATIGGNICLNTRCWYYNQSRLWRDARPACHKTGGSTCYAIRGSDRCHALNSSDTAPVLSALNAAFRIVRKNHERRVPAREFYNHDGSRPTVLHPEELLTSIVIPPRESSVHTVFIKTSPRQGLDFAVASIAAAAKVEGKKCKTLCLVINSVCSAPLLLVKAAGVILKSGLTDKTIEQAADTARSELGPLTNLFTSAGYKRDLARVLVKRALTEIKKTVSIKSR